MSTDLITWKRERFAMKGMAGGFSIFSIHWGMTRQENMWSLSTSLPIRSTALGQVHPTETHAKVAAERLLRKFIKRLSTPPSDADA